MLSFDLSGKGGPTSSYAAAGIALWIIASHTPPYPAKDAFVKVEIPQGGLKTILFYIIGKVHCLKPETSSAFVCATVAASATGNVAVAAVCPVV